MASCNPFNVIEIIKSEFLSKYPDLIVSPIHNVTETRFAKVLFNQIDEMYQNNLFIEEDTSLFSRNEFQSDSESDNSDFEPDEEFSTLNNVVDNTVAIRVNEYASSHSIGQTAKKFKKSKRVVQNIIERAEKGQTQREKIKIIKKFMMSNFISSRNQYCPVHECHLKSWGLHKANELGLSTFKASRNFINTFKTENRIVSRKVTKYVTNINERNVNIEEIAREFVSNTNELFWNTDVPSCCIFNTDQSRFEYEISTVRTLSNKGERNTLGNVQSIQATTHSYTVQILLSKSGELGDVYICFQERNGTFGPHVRQSISQAQMRFANTYIDCSRSGKMEKRNIVNWVKHVLNKKLGPKNILIQDSFTSQNDFSLYNSNIDNSKQIVIKTIPPKTTYLIQPLDVYFFRQYKLFAKKITEYIKTMAIESDEILRSRDFIIKMHSIIHNQLSSPKFKPMLLYAWSKSGYFMEETYSEFKNVKEISFQIDNEICMNEDCENDTFITCSHCEGYLCYDHLMGSHIHFH